MSRNQNCAKTKFKLDVEVAEFELWFQLWPSTWFLAVSSWNRPLSGILRPLVHNGSLKSANLLSSIRVISNSISSVVAWFQDISTFMLHKDTSALQVALGAIASQPESTLVQASEGITRLAPLYPP